MERCKTSLFYCVVTFWLLEPSVSMCSNSLIVTESMRWLNEIGIFFFLIHTGTSTNTFPEVLNINSKSENDWQMKLNPTVMSIQQKVNAGDFLYSNQSRSMNTNPGRTGKQRQFKEERSKKSARKKTKPEKTISNVKVKSKLGKQELNLDEKGQEKSLRSKILTQLGAADPLLCLPKALCGVSSRRQKKASLSTNHNTMNSFKQEDLDNTLMDDNFINNYLEIMKTVLPTTEPLTVQRRGTNSKKPKSWFNSKEESSSEESNESSDGEREYLREKLKIQKWIKEEEYDPEPNWWDMLPPTKAYHNVDEKHLSPSKPPEDKDWYTFSTASRISRRIHSFFNSIIPVVKWGLGKTPDVFADDPFFQEFRRSFSGRSLTDGDQLRFGWLFRDTDQGQGANEKYYEPIRQNRKRLDSEESPSGRDKLERSKNKVKKGHNIDRSKKLFDDGLEKEKVIDDPVETFQLAVEIGKHMDDPKQCDYVFTGCPFSHQEIIDIIESSRKSLLKEKEFEKDLFDELGSDESSKHKTPEIDSTGTFIHEMPSGDRLQINLKVSDKNEVTITPEISVSSNKGVNSMSERTIPPLQEPTTELPHVTNENSLNSPLPPPSEHGNKGQSSRTTLLDTDHQINIDTVEETLPLKSVTSKPKPKHNTHRRKKVKPNKGKKPKRKQWGLQHHEPPVKSPPPPNIFRESLHHTHTSYKPIPLPTTINKPSHVINYHFHNTNTHPHPQHLPPPPPATITTPSSPTNSPAYTQPEERLRDSHTHFPPRRPKKSKKKHRKPSSDERIVIKLPESSPSNNYYNLYPSVPIVSTNYPTQPPQPHPPLRSHHHHYNQRPHFDSLYHNPHNYNHYNYPYQTLPQLPPPHPHAYPSMELQSQPLGYYPPPPITAPSLPPAMFPYLFGKK